MKAFLIFRGFANQAIIMHDVLHTLMINLIALVAQLLVHTTYPIPTFVVMVDFLDYLGNLFISFLYRICLGNLVIIGRFRHA